MYTNTHTLLHTWECSWRGCTISVTANLIKESWQVEIQEWSQAPVSSLQVKFRYIFKRKGENKVPARMDVYTDLLKVGGWTSSSFTGPFSPCFVTHSWIFWTMQTTTQWMADIHFLIQNILKYQTSYIWTLEIYTCKKRQNTFLKKNLLICLCDRNKMILLT